MLYSLLSAFRCTEGVFLFRISSPNRWPRGGCSSIGLGSATTLILEVRPAIISLPETRPPCRSKNSPRPSMILSCSIGLQYFVRARCRTSVSVGALQAHSSVEAHRSSANALAPQPRPAHPFLDFHISAPLPSDQQTDVFFVPPAQLTCSNVRVASGSLGWCILGPWLASVRRPFASVQLSPRQ